MVSYTAHDLVLLLAAGLALLGGLSIAAGILVLITRSAGKDVQTLAAQTTRLAQKGIAEDVAGLVGNASSLVESLNQLTQTSAGVGIFLVIIGFIMLIVAFLMVKFF